MPHHVYGSRYLFEEDRSAPPPANAATGPSARRTSGNGAFTPPTAAGGGDSDLEAAGGGVRAGVMASGAVNGVSLARTSLDEREIALGGRFSSRQVELTEPKV